MTEKNPVIVVIDDSAASVSLYKRSAEGLNVTLKTFESPSESLAYLESHTADLIFTDLIMREADGWGILKRLNDWAHHRGTPVIVVTSKNYSQDRTLAKQLGANEFLVKPVRSQEIREIICKYTGAESVNED